MKKIVITGAKGNIGKVLTKGLVEYDIIPVDLPEVDVCNYNKISDILKEKDTVIHLAWNSKTENCINRKIDPSNTKMFENVYEASLKQGVKRVIMASSVHAQEYRNWKGPKLIPIKDDTKPDSPYGKHKIEMEKLGQFYSTKGLEVICIRFGAVCPLEGPWWKELPDVGLSYPDCVDLIRKCLEAKEVPNNFVVMYAVSKNKKRVHDYKNPFGWEPKTDSEEFYKKQALLL